MTKIQTDGHGYNPRKVNIPSDNEQELAELVKYLREKVPYSGTMYEDERFVLSDEHALEKLQSFINQHYTKRVKLELISDEAIKRIKQWYTSDKTLFKSMLGNYNPTAALNIIKQGAKSQLQADQKKVGNENG